MAKQTNTGIIYSLAAEEPATQTKEAYESLSFTETCEITNIPAFGATVAVVESNPLKTGVTEKFKGFKNYGSVSLDMDFDLGDDEGQALLESGADGANDAVRYSHKLEYPNGEVRYFQGQIFSFTENPGGQNSMITANANVEISTPIVRVAAP